VTYVPIDCLVVSSAHHIRLARLGHTTDYTHPKPYQNSLLAGYSFIQVVSEFVRRLAFLNPTHISALTPVGNYPFGIRFKNKLSLADKTFRQLSSERIFIVEIRRLSREYR
jgi:hypothetical protein